MAKDRPTKPEGSSTSASEEGAGRDSPPGKSARLRKYPVAKTREGKRVATVYLEKDALRQLRRIALEEETTLQALLVEGVNAVFAARNLDQIA